MLPNTGNRSFFYGDGFFETIRVINGTLPLLDFHLERAQDTAQYMCMDWPGNNDLSQRIDRYLREYKDGVLRLTFYRSGDGLYQPNSSAISLHISFREIAPNGASVFHYSERKIDLKGLSNLRARKVAIYPKESKPMVRQSNYKLTSAAFYVLAGCYLKDQSEIDDLIITNTSGRVCEGLSSAIVVQRGAKLFSPPLSEGPVDSVYVRFLEKHHGLKREELSINDLDKADAVYFVNAAKGFQRVELVR